MQSAPPDVAVRPRSITITPNRPDLTISMTSGPSPAVAATSISSDAVGAAVRPSRNIRTGHDQLSYLLPRAETLSARGSQTP